MMTRVHKVHFHLTRKERSEAERFARELIAISTKFGFAPFIPYGQAALQWATADRVDASRAADKIGLTIRDSEKLGFRVMNAGLVRMLIETLIEAGRFEEARRACDRGLEHGSDTQQLNSQAELLRLKGEVALLQNANATVVAQAAFEGSLERSRRFGTKLYEIRTTTSLARMWAGVNKRAEARDLLAPVYDWFTEGFDTRDLKDAKALLDELS
jgi:predicted ATPase